MDLNYYQAVAETLILDSFPEEWEPVKDVAPQFCGTVVDPKAVFGQILDKVSNKIRHLRLLRDEIATFPSNMAPQALTLYVRKHYGSLYKELKEMLRQEYHPMLTSRIDWSVADRFDKEGFTVCYDKRTDLLQVKVGDSAIEL